MKYWVQITSMFILLVVTINTGVLNYQVAEQRRMINQVAFSAQSCDLNIYNSIQQLAKNLDYNVNFAQRVAAQRMPSVVSVHTDFTYASGVVISENGTILTAAHVADTASLYGRMWVEFEDGTTRDAWAVGYAPGRSPDVGIIRIDPNGLDLTAVPIDPSIRETVVKGDSVVVLGNPHGLNHSVVDGIVSDPNRTAGDFLLREQNYIHISGPSIPGLSGGPIFDIHGNLLGILSCGHTHTSFIVPTDIILEALTLCEELEMVHAFE